MKVAVKLGLISFLLTYAFSSYSSATTVDSKTKNKTAVTAPSKDDDGDEEDQEEQAEVNAKKTSEPDAAIKGETPKQIPPAKKQFKFSDLNEEERYIYERGEIGTAAYVAGGILGTYPFGLGIGHAIQGRYSQRGWIFTVGELGSFAIISASFLNCVTRTGCSGGGIVLGVLGYVGFRIWEIVDLWAYPPEHNRRYEQIKSHLGDLSEHKFEFKPAVSLNDEGTPLFGMRMTF